jgi:hypothetical protein
MWRPALATFRREPLRRDICLATAFFFGLFVRDRHMNWRKLKAEDHVFVFPNLYPCVVVGVGKPEGRHGVDTKVYLRRLDSDGQRIMVRAAQVYRTIGLIPLNRDTTVQDESHGKLGRPDS